MTMSLHSLVNTRGARHRRIRVGRGRGSGKGKTCGRGGKGQTARKGHKHKHGFEGGQMPLIRRIPKRGFKHAFGRKLMSVNVQALDVFDSETEVTPELMRSRGVTKGIADGVKVLGAGDLTKKLVVKAQAFSASAKAKIEGLGGRCEVLGR